MDAETLTPALNAIKVTVLAVLTAAVIVLAISPNITKPLFVKYYRAVYQAEAVKSL